MDRYRIIQGDCLEVRKGGLEVPDAIVADPPYGISLHKMSGGDRTGSRLDPMNRFRPDRGPDAYRIEGDDQPFDPSPWLDCPRVVLWGANHYASRLPDARCWLVWDKREGCGSNDQADCELAWTNLPGPARVHHQMWNGLCRRGEENINWSPRLHPAQKPVALMEFCLRLCRLPAGALVLDPYMGSGSTGVAALRLGLRFIGIELRADYCDIARRRLEVAAAGGVQGDLMEGL